MPFEAARTHIAFQRKGVKDVKSWLFTRIAFKEVFLRLLCSKKVPDVQYLLGRFHDNSDRTTSTRLIMRTTF